MRIVLDAMGSDNHPKPELEAAVEAQRLWGERLTLTGPAGVLEPQVDPALVRARLHAEQRQRRRA